MERTFSTEERIKRAEELYYKRKIQSGDVPYRSTTRVNIATQNNKLPKTVLQKMLLQMLICFVIYLIIYIIQNTNYFFSEEVINKTKEILSYDINFSNLYQQFIQWFEVNENGFQQEENIIVPPEEENTQEQLQQTSQTGQEDIQQLPEETLSATQTIEEEASSLEPMQIDANDIKNTISIIKPLSGTVTSEFGPRDEPEEIVSSYHTGIDIAANEGTIIISAMDGTVTVATNDSGYGNYIKIEKGDITTLYAHCKTLYVKQGDEIKQGQNIAEVGRTGNATGNHLHFEVRKSDRLVNPRYVVEI